MAVLQDLVAEGIRKQMAPHRRYLAASARAAIADDAAAVAIAVLIDVTGGADHIVKSDGETFTLQHPLTERLTGDLFDCEIHAHIEAGDPIDKGRYRVVPNDNRSLKFIPTKEYA